MLSFTDHQFKYLQNIQDNTNITVQIKSGSKIIEIKACKCTGISISGSYKGAYLLNNDIMGAEVGKENKGNWRYSFFVSNTRELSDFMSQICIKFNAGLQDIHIKNIIQDSLYEITDIILKL